MVCVAEEFYGKLNRLRIFKSLAKRTIKTLLNTENQNYPIYYTII